MRIRFGLILKITERTKSYKPPKQHYFIKTPETQAKLPLFSGSHPNYSSKHCSLFINAVVEPLLDTVRKLLPCAIREMRIRFGTILSLLIRPRDDENMVWIDSQDYGADEILSHPFILTPPVQRAACALHFEGCPQLFRIGKT